jgi:hypothetical protein
MALSPKEREKIIEEERLRYETRQALHAEACAKHPRRGRWLWWLAAGLLAYAAWCWIACGGGSCLRGGAEGHAGCKHGQAKAGCMHGQGGADGVEPGQPIPDKR